MKKLLVIAIVVAAACLIGSVAFAADTMEQSVTVTANNPVTREIDTMVAFGAITITSADRDSGKHDENSSGNLVVSSNAGWKLQVKEASRTGSLVGPNLYIKYGAGSFTSAMTGAYGDIPNTVGNAGGSISSAMTFSLDTTWTASTGNGSVDVYIKILSDV